jgi:hypothetical protein
MTSEVELKEIRSLLLKLNKKVDRLNDLVEERLIGSEEPPQEDVAAIKEYEAAKKNGKLKLVPLEDLTKGILRLIKQLWL